MKQLGAAGSRQTNEMLEIGRARGDRADGRFVRHATARGQQRDDGESAQYFEAAVMDVAVRDAVAGEVEWNAE